MFFITFFHRHILHNPLHITGTSTNIRNSMAVSKSYSISKYMRIIILYEIFCLYNALNTKYNAMICKNTSSFPNFEFSTVLIIIPCFGLITDEINLSRLHLKSHHPFRHCLSTHILIANMILQRLHMINYVF